MGQACYAIEAGLATLEQLRRQQGRRDRRAWQKARELAAGAMRELAGQPAERITFAYWASELAELVRQRPP